MKQGWESNVMRFSSFANRLEYIEPRTNENLLDCSREALRDDGALRQRQGEHQHLVSVALFGAPRQHFFCPMYTASKQVLIRDYPVRAALQPAAHAVKIAFEILASLVRKQQSGAEPVASNKLNVRVFHLKKKRTFAHKQFPMALSKP